MPATLARVQEVDHNREGLRADLRTEFAQPVRRPVDQRHLCAGRQHGPRAFEAYAGRRARDGRDLPDEFLCHRFASFRRGRATSVSAAQGSRR